MAASEQFSDQIKNIRQAESGAVIAGLITQERAQKMDLLIHLITNLKQSLIVCGPKGIGKTTLLALFHEHYANQWPMVFLSSTAQLSFEQIQAHLFKRLMQPGSANIPQSLNILLRGLEKFHQPVVLVCDDAGLMMPGLMTTLMQYATAFPCLRIVFALTDDELADKRRGDPVIDECYFIEIPALSETQGGECWQQLAGQQEALEDVDLGYDFDKVHAFSFAIKAPKSTKIKDFYFKFTEALPDLSKMVAVKGFSWFYVFLMAGVLALSAGLGLFKNTDSSVTADLPVQVSAPLAIPGQTAPEPVAVVSKPKLNVAAVEAVVAAGNKPLLPEMSREPNFYKGHGRSLEGDALTEFELNNTPIAIQSVGSEQLKIEIIPPEPVKTGLLSDLKAPLSVTTEATAVAQSGGVLNTMPEAKQALSNKLKIVAEPVHAILERVANTPKQLSNKIGVAAKPVPEKITLSQPLQVVVGDAKKQSALLIKAQQVKNLKLKTLEKIKLNSNNAVATQREALKPITEAPKVIEPEKNASVERSKPPVLITAKPVLVKQAVTQPDVVLPTKAKAVKSDSSDKASSKPSKIHYTLQLMSFTQPALLAEFMRKHSAMGSSLRTIKTNKDGSDKYVVVYGTFESNAQAAAAKQKLPAEFSQAWPRKM